VLFCGILNLLIYVCFDERRQRIFVGLASTVIGMSLLYHGCFRSRMVDMKDEYDEGPKAGGNFQQLARAVFQFPKVAVPKKRPQAKPKHRRMTGSDKG